ncbi:hypothetical protein ACI2OX_07665 [Bacillus sp. N9]
MVSQKMEKNIEGTATFNPISSDVKELTITPYFNLPKEDKVSEFNSEGKEVEFDLTKLKDSELQFDSFTVLIEK